MPLDEGEADDDGQCREQRRRHCRTPVRRLLVEIVEQQARPDRAHLSRGQDRHRELQIVPRPHEGVEKDGDHRRPGDRQHDAVHDQQFRRAVGARRDITGQCQQPRQDEAGRAAIRAKLQDELLDLQAKLKRTIIFVSHDLDEAFKIGNRIALMEGGRLVPSLQRFGGLIAARFVAEGLGVSIVNGLLASHFAHLPIVTRPFRPMLPYTFGLAFRRDEARPALVSSFAEHLKQRLGESTQQP